MLGRFIKGPGDPKVAARAEPTARWLLSRHYLRRPKSNPYGDDFLTLKVELHRHLIDRFNLTALEIASKDEILDEIRPIVREFVRARAVPLNARELDQLTSDTADEMLGLGPIEPLLKDDFHHRYPDQYAQARFHRAAWYHRRNGNPVSG